MAGNRAEPTREPELRRLIGPGLLVLFVIGDLLGTGIYSLTGQVARHVGGAVWLPFLLAVVVAIFTAASYLELVTKYPRAAGAAHFVGRAFRRRSLTFLVGFAVMASGIASASTASRAFAANLFDAFGLGPGGSWGVGVVGGLFLLGIAAINLRGLGHGLVANVLLTCVEAAGLLLVVAIGARAIGSGEADPSRALQFRSSAEGGAVWPAVTATTLAFFAMLGFEDSVNMVEETRDPSRTFPRALLAGLGLTALLYVAVSVVSVAVVPPERLAEGETPLLQVVAAGAPGFPLWVFGAITMFAVANTALLNMLMASRLVYGMSREGRLPPVLGRIHPARRTPAAAIPFTTAVALALVGLGGGLPVLAGTTTLLLLAVFAVVNVAVLVLRRDRVPHPHFRAPTPLPVLGAASCAFLVGPWTGRSPEQYTTAGVLLGLGLLLWLATELALRRRRPVDGPIPPQDSPRARPERPRQDFSARPTSPTDAVHPTPNKSPAMKR